MNIVSFVWGSTVIIEKCVCRYGNLVLLDATYKTQRQAVPLFFMAVKTNMRYLPVALFMVQQEKKENILEALEIIKHEMLKYGFVFRNFMVDFSMAEISALEAAFPGKEGSIVLPMCISVD